MSSTNKRLIFSIILILMFIGLLSGCSNLNSPKVEISLIVDYENVPKEVEFGSDLNLTGLSVKVLLSDGTYKTLPRGGEDGYEVEDGGYDPLISGEYTITISYKKDKFKEVSFKITILEEEIIDENENRDIVLVGIEVKDTVGKKIFIKGQPFSTEDIIVETVFSDGSRELVAAPQYEVDSSDYNQNETGKYTITIRYYPNYNLSDTYEVTVIEYSQPPLVGITIKTDEAKTGFLYGESFDWDGLIIEKHYDNDGIIETSYAEHSEIQVRADDYDENELGDQTINVSIVGTEISSNYTIQVIDFIESISANYSKNNYVLGEDFLEDTISVYITMASGDRFQGDIEDYTIDSSAYDSEQEGTYDIIVTHKDNLEISTSFTVYVNE